MFANHFCRHLRVRIGVLFRQKSLVRRLRASITGTRTAAESSIAAGPRNSHPLTKIGPAAKDLKLSIPTVTSALETLSKLKIAKESTGKRRDRLFAYPRYLHILSEGTEPLKSES
jgi:Fic family protein